MKNYFSHALFMLLFSITMGIVIDVPVSSADDERPPVLVAYLSGSQQVDGTESAAQGKVMFYLSNDGNELYFNLQVRQINNAVAAHIHMAPWGKDGRAVAALFDFYAYPRKGSFNGVVSEGVITAADLIGPLVGSPFSTLLREMAQGDTYVNIHTKEYPRGYIRGQIVDPEGF